MVKFKKVIAIALACALTVGTAMTATAADTSAQKPAAPTAVTSSTSVKATSGAYVKTNANGTATLTKAYNKTQAVVGTATVGGVKYSVNAIAANAFKNTKKVKSVYINTSNKKITIKKNAFAKSKVTKVKFRGFKSASNVSIQKGAFKSSKVKTILVSKTMSKSQFNKLKKALRKAGYKGSVRRG